MTDKEKIKENMSTIAIKTSLIELPKYCEDCLYYECRPHPYKGWSDTCGLCAQCLDDDNGDDGWVYDGNGRPKKCPLMEVENEDNPM